MSRDHPLFVVTLARPELIERRTDWGAGKRRFTSLVLEPLDDDAMDQLLHGLVPGLPSELAAQIRGQAEGVPLYAVETVRMLLDRGLLVRREDRFELTGPMDTLDVPESLQSLIAARLDGLPPDERKLLQDGAVLGKTFSRPAIAALTRLPDERLTATLDSLVRRELLTVQHDPRATDHGSYGFLQSLVQKIAYDTLSKKDRKAGHLAVADHLERTWSGDEDEIVEVLASHYVEAYRLAPDAADASSIRATACGTLARAGRRAQSLAAPRAARGYYLRAAELADTDTERASMKELAGFMADISGMSDDAIADLEEAADLFAAAGDTHAAARVSARIGDAMWNRSMLDEALTRMQPAFETLKEDEPDADVAMLAAQLGRIQFFEGHLDEATEAVDFALDVAESLWLPETISEAMNTKGLIAASRGRPEESLALIKRSLEIALENDAPGAAIRAYINLANEMFERDRFEDSDPLDLEALALCRRIGWTGLEWFVQIHIASHHWLVGEWDELFGMMNDAPSAEEEPAVRSGIEGIAYWAILAAIHRGEIDDAMRFFGVWDDYGDSADVQVRSIYDVLRATIANATGDHGAALQHARDAFDVAGALSTRHTSIKFAFIEAVEAGMALGDREAADRFLSIVEGWSPGSVTPFIRAMTDRFRARLDPDPPRRRDGSSGRRGCSESSERRSTWRAPSSNTGSGSLAGRADDAEPLLAEARETFERLGANPWLDRLDEFAPSRMGT